MYPQTLMRANGKNDQVDSHEHQGTYFSKLQNGEGR